MKLRKLQGKLKVEHHILAGVRDLLETLLDSTPAIRSVIPGVIKPVRDARGEVKVRVTVPTSNGWKAIALSDGARQELFISTALSKEDLEHVLRRIALANARGSETPILNRDRRHEASCPGDLVRGQAGALRHPLAKGTQSE